MHPLSLSHGHNLEPSLMAFLGDTLCPSSSSRPASTGQCPSQAPCCNPACRFLGKAAALARSLSKAWEEIPLSSAPSSLQINSYPLVAPQNLSAAHPNIPHHCHVHCCPHFHAQPHHAMSPMGLSHHHARDTTTPPQLLSTQGTVAMHWGPP